MGDPNGTNGHYDAKQLPALSTTAEDFLKHTYDYIIVGGGTAGLTIAARLTENPDVSVGVLEAGKNKLGDMFVDTPAMYLQTFNNPEYDWAFMTEPQKQNHGKRHHIPRGKLLGGSSGINYEMYVRGSDQDFDDWAIISDDSAWGSENMKHYMRKHQTLEPVDEAVAHRNAMLTVGEYHGTSGPVHTSFNDFFLPIEDDVIAAADEVTGLSKKPNDPWSGDHIGFFNTLATVCRTGPNKGKRSYAARGYFETNAQRPNLHVLCEALVSSVTLEGDRATGIKFSHESATHNVSANREIIVCCGAIQSPQILELSGIGDPDVLKAAGVECKVKSLGVGNNYQDHPLSGLGWELVPSIPSLEIIYDPNVMQDAQKQLMEKQGGPLSCIPSTQGFFPYKLFATEDEQAAILKSAEDTLPTLTPFQKKQHLRTIEHLKSDKSANLQLVFIAHQAGWEEGGQDQSKLFPPTAPGQPLGIMAAICLQYPLSRGSVHIKNSDPTEHPALDPGFLTHLADTAVLAAGVKMLDKMAKSQHLKDKIAKRVYPASEMDLNDTEQAKQVVHDFVLSEYHPVGSCAMGEVVDSRLKVNGVQNLRVADASVFPNHVSGNCVSAVYALAEHAADIIKADWDQAALAKAK